MSDSPLAAPQLVINSRMLYSSWIPADPKAAAALLPQGLQPATNRAIYMNQYVVDSEEQASSFGAYSLTYLGLDLAGRTAPDGVTPSRFFTHYFNSSERVRGYVRERGVPASPGTTTLELHGVVMPMQIPIELRWAESRAGALQVDAAFDVKLSDHEIPRPQMLFMKLGETQRVVVSLVAAPAAPVGDAPSAETP